MNELQIFKHEEFGKVRGVMINSQPWFVGKDVAKALQYKDSKAAIRDHVDKEDKLLIQKGQNTPLEFNIPNRGLNVINESGLYSLIFSSKMPAAKEFKRWVTSEVLPQIRQNGMYIDKRWIETREQGKLVRRNFTDVLKEFFIYAKAQGTSRPECVFYSYYSKLCNKLAGLPTKKGRDGATIQQLGFCSWIEDRMAEIFDSGMKKNLPYKEIEGYVKTWAENLATIIKMPLAIVAAKN